MIRYSALRLLSSLLIAFFLMSGSVVHGQQKNMNGPLRVCKSNPRYFADERGKAVYLTGVHTWNNLVDMKSSPDDEGFDFDTYLKWMKFYHFNFIRLWAWEILNWVTSANREDHPKNLAVAPHPWARTGPGMATDGLPKFDLNKFNEAYFNRLSARIGLAEKNGIYVSIMLFEGWGLQFSPKAFENHPFYPANNINGINGDLNGDGKGLEIHSLKNGDILEIQKKYVKKVIDVVNGFDNVLYEISNENHPPSTKWQYYMINFIKDYERQMPKQHPVGMTFQYKGGSNQTLFNSPADWISPNEAGGYRYHPPAADGRKVIITDTDHLWGIGGNERWVWKSFCRGLNPIFMDTYDGKILSGKIEPERAERTRINLGYSRMMADQIDLTFMIPHNSLASSGYCLAKKGAEYLVYLPEERTVTLDLSGNLGVFTTEWFDPESGEFSEGPVVNGGGKVSFTSPKEKGHILLHIKSKL